MISAPTVPAPILPGGCLGVVGNGQLARMFAQAAQRMGYRVIPYGPEHPSPASRVCDEAVVAAYDDTAALERFAQQVQAVTLEFENVPVEALQVLERHVPVRPGPHILYTCQHRLREKTFLKEHGFPTVPFQAVRSQADLDAALQTLGTPAVLKTAGFGYDGKGQVLLKTAEDAVGLYEKRGGVESILEAFVNFECEVSLIVARGLEGAVVSYPLFENRHRHHILDVTSIPARVQEALEQQAEQLGRRLAEAFDLVGLLCIEFFVVNDAAGTPALFINELAPRPHNSGHVTIEACVTSQFEQQVRTLCGLPLGNPQPVAPAAAMANLLGDLWSPPAGAPNWNRMLGWDDVKLHLYQKTEARPGRKMGHLTLLGDSLDGVLARIQAAQAALTTE